jgi:CDP-glucose 4,6-dehydratase
VSRGEPLIVRNPYAIRPWQHVLEPLSGYLLLAQRLWKGKGRYSEAWNFGPDEDSAQSVETVVSTLARSWGDGAEWRRDEVATHPHEATYLKLDCSKAKAKLGWRAHLDLPTALDWTTAWYKACRERKDMRKFSLGQVAAYMERTTA